MCREVVTHQGRETIGKTENGVTHETLLIFLVSNNLKNHGIRHLKLFTNCHVSWDTLCDKTNKTMSYHYSILFIIGLIQNTA